ncbi:MAG: hypothetical protein J5835_07330 [Bacteroidales bacterium]|nr:hypothetical protein [Bacteroidales bacterium]
MTFALVGHPVEGSLSPLLFDAAYGGRYPYLLEDCPSFRMAWNCLDIYDGVNVTAPYKEEASTECHWLSDKALRSGAVNLVLSEGRRGYNTDVDGVLWALDGVPSGTALVVGTGGAARAAITAVQELGCKVSVWGRNPSKVAELEKRFGLCPPVKEPSIVIYTLPGSAPVPEGVPFEGAVVLEANYRNPKLAGVGCRRYIPGHRWLLGQAAAGYELFTSEAPDIAAMTAVMERFCSKYNQIL